VDSLLRSCQLEVRLMLSAFYVSPLAKVWTDTTGICVLKMRDNSFVGSGL
jgi:hypothetical protein